MAPNEPIDPIEALRADVNRMLEGIHAENPIAATVVFLVNPASEEQFARNAVTLTAATRALSGCNLFSFHKAVKQSRRDAVEYLIYEDWQTRRQFQRQWNSDHLRQFQATVGALIVATPDLRFYTGWQRAAAPATSDAMPDLTSWLLLPLHLSVRGMREVGRFFQPADDRGHGEAPRAVVARPSSRREPPQRPPSAIPPAPAHRATGWGPIPYPVPVIERPQGSPRGESSASDDYPFESHHLSVLGSRMHYIDEGRGDPILFLHGNPTWSYTWRNIIPHLARRGRCIAPDLVGFGRSSKPDIEYRWSDHVRYLERFIERLDLRNITLVLHDHGSGLGFDYAMRHPYNVKAIAFFEALVRPFEWDHFSTPEFRELFRAFRSGGVHGQGWQMIVDQNIFIEQLLPRASGRPLSATAMRYYREPFTDPSARMPIWQFARETAIGGEPRDVWDAVSEYSIRLQRSPIPKLLLYAQPGALLTAEHVEWCRRSLPNLETVSVGDGAHFLQESSPHQIGTEIASWLDRLASQGEPAYATGR